MPDTLGFRKRIGIIVPSTNTTVGPECELFRVPGVTCHTGRVTIRERPLNTEEAFLEHMTMMREGMGTAIIGSCCVAGVGAAVPSAADLGRSAAEVGGV